MLFPLPVVVYHSVLRTNFYCVCILHLSNVLAEVVSLESVT